MPTTGTVTSASSSDPLPENVGELLKAFNEGQSAPAPEATVPESAPETPTESPTSAPAEPEGSAPAKVEPEWQKVLETVAEEELFSHPKLSGRFGRAVQKLVDKKLGDLTTQQAQVARQRELDQLADQDPQAYVARVQQDRQRTQATAALYQEVYTPLRAHFSELDPQVQSELAGKSYEHLPPGEQALAYIRDSFEATVKARVDRAVKAATKEAREAGRKEALAELNGRGPRPDTGSSSGGAPAYSLKDVATMPDADYKKLGRTPQERMAALGGRRSA